MSMTEPVAWAKREDEPVAWYYKFSRFYLTLGPNRSFYKAYRTYLSIEEPERYKDEDASSGSTPSDWSTAAEQYEWLVRAMEYDEKMFTSEGIVELAREKLKNSTLQAADALIEALSNPRLTVAAAKEILDRSGVLAATVNINKAAEFSADELAAAAEEIEQWQTNVKNG